MEAIRERFSMIDVVKHQLEASKKGSKNKLLTLTNEVKIITSSEPTFDLWKEVITCAAQGDLVDVDSKDLEKFKEHKNFEPEKDGVLSREFFKFLGNLSEAVSAHPEPVETVQEVQAPEGCREAADKSARGLLLGEGLD
jgi:hypothetical protein